MLLSFSIIFILGMTAGWLFNKVKLPPLMGMLVVGIVIGPHCFNLLDSSILAISAELRRTALIIILIRAGLNLKIRDLQKVGRSAVLMCFLPASFEIIGMLILAPAMLNTSITEALILGTVIAAVSPAVIIPHMLKIMDEGYGVKKSIPQMILAGASVDDVFVIVLFTVFTKIASGGEFKAINLMRIPTSVIFGIAAGAIAGCLLGIFLKKVSLSRIKKLIIFLSVSFILVTVEDAVTGILGFSGLIAIMFMSIVFADKDPKTTQKLSEDFSQIWAIAEIVLFVLVGAEVDIGYAFKAGAISILLLLGVLLFRMLGVALCVAGTSLNKKERLFCVIAYTPKATVQAAIGAIPLTLGLSCGNMVLTVAVIAILITAPLGALLIELTYKKLLSR